MSSFYRNFAQIYEVANISYNMENFQKVFAAKQFYSLFLNLSLKLGFRILFWRMEYYVCVFNKNVTIWKSSFGSKNTKKIEKNYFNRIILFNISGLKFECFIEIDRFVVEK